MEINRLLFLYLLISSSFLLVFILFILQNRQLFGVCYQEVEVLLNSLRLGIKENAHLIEDEEAVEEAHYGEGSGHHAADAEKAHESGLCWSRHWQLATVQLPLAQVFNNGCCFRFCLALRYSIVQLFCIGIRSLINGNDIYCPQHVPNFEAQLLKKSDESEEACLDKADQALYHDYESLNENPEIKSIKKSTGQSLFILNGIVETFAENVW